MKMNPTPGLSAESLPAAVQALINARSRARDHRNSEIESFTQHLQSHVRCIEHYDREIADITAALAQLCPQMSGEPQCGQQAATLGGKSLGGWQK